MAMKGTSCTTIAAPSECTRAICTDIAALLPSARHLEKKILDSLLPYQNKASNATTENSSKAKPASMDAVTGRKRLNSVLGEIRDLSNRIKDHIADNIIDKLKDSRNIGWVIQELQILLVHILELEACENVLKRLLQELPKTNNKNPKNSSGNNNSSRTKTSSNDTHNSSGSSNNSNSTKNSQAKNTQKQQKKQKYEGTKVSCSPQPQPRPVPVIYPHTPPPPPPPPPTFCYPVAAEAVGTFVQCPLQYDYQHVINFDVMQQYQLQFQQQLQWQLQQQQQQQLQMQQQQQQFVYAPVIPMPYCHPGYVIREL